MAGWLSINKTALRPTVFLELATQARYLQRKIPHDVTGLHGHQPDRRFQGKQWVSDVPI